MRPLARQARLQVGELRDLDLQLAFQGARTQREDIENQLAAIDHAQLEFIFKIARLRGRERVVEDHERRARLMRELANLGRLALANKGARVRSLELLADRRLDAGPGAQRERAKLRQ